MRALTRARLALSIAALAVVWPSGSSQSQSKSPIAGQRATQVKKPNDLSLTPQQIFERVFPSLALVIGEDENGNPISQGSGFFYQRGLVATNLHVLTRASKASMKVLKTARTYPVIEVAGIDILRDLCVLRINDKSSPPLTPKSSVLSNLSTGDDIYVAGNPKGLEGSFSRGIVSRIRPEMDLIQIDAPISPGSSGGPVVNNRAEVIGIAQSSVVGGQNLNFAIPIEDLLRLKLSSRISVLTAASFALRDRDKDKLRGMVKKVTISRAYYRFDEFLDKYVEEEPEVEEESQYDLDGNKIEVISYVGGKMISKEVYRYDKEGFKIHETIVLADGTKREIEWNREKSSNERIERRMFSVTIKTWNGELTYDQNGDEIVMTGKENGVLDKWVSTSDRNGFVSERKYYQNERLHEIRRFTYEADAHGNWVKQYETAYQPVPKEPGVVDYGYLPSAVVYRKIVYW